MNKLEETDEYNKSFLLWLIIAIPVIFFMNPMEICKKVYLVHVYCMVKLEDNRQHICNKMVPIASGMKADLNV